MPAEPKPKRATVYFEPELHRALRLKAAEVDGSVSELVNDAVRAALAEDAADLEEMAVREPEPEMPFEAFVRDLKRRGRDIASSSRDRRRKRSARCPRRSYGRRSWRQSANSPRTLARSAA